jgi:hypothetical protein
MDRYNSVKRGTYERLFYSGAIYSFGSSPLPFQGQLPSPPLNVVLLGVGLSQASEDAFTV